MSTIDSLAAVAEPVLPAAVEPLSAPPPASPPRHRRAPRTTAGRLVDAAARTIASRLSARVAMVAVVAAWATVIAVAPYIEVGPVLHRLALFAHLAALLLGFGAVLTVDWFGLLWLTGRRTLTDVVHTAKGAHVPIWFGVLGLMGSGALLSPDLGSKITMIKLCAVLVVALNGVYVGGLHKRFAVYDYGVLPRPLLARSVLAGGVSQLGWWVAIVIGFLNSSS